MKNIEHIIQLAKNAGYLKRIKRTGWVRVGVTDPESVGDHIFRTAFLCMILTRDRNIDHKRILEMALIHDLGESATSDIRYEEGSNVIASEEAKNKIEEDILRRIFTPIDKDNYFLNLWYEFRDQTTEEARLLKQIEKIEMALQAMEYQSLGLSNQLFTEFKENARKYVKARDLRKLLLAIIEE